MIKILADTELTYRPKKDDIIFGEIEFDYGRFKNNDKKIVEVGILDNKKCIKKDTVIETMFSKGKVFEFKKNIEIDLTSNDDTRHKAVWHILDIKLEKKFKGLHGEYPEHYFIKAQRLSSDNKIDENGEIIEFYTCGNKDNLITRKCEVLGRYEK